MPRRTYERLQDYAEMWATRGVRAGAEGWWEMPQTLGDEVGRIIGAEPGTVVMHQNVSVCQSLILSCFDTSPETRRNKIVYSELEFPSAMYVYEAHARDRAFRLQRVKSEDGITAPRAAGRGASRARLIPVGRHRALQREGFGRGLLHGRLGQVALRRARRRLPL